MIILLSMIQGGFYVGYSTLSPQNLQSPPSQSPSRTESWWEFIERSYNYGVPFILFLTYGAGKNIQQWFEKIHYKDWIHDFSEQKMVLFESLLRLIIALALIGHGPLGLFVQKKILLQHSTLLPIVPMILSPAILTAAFGLWKILLGFWGLFRPTTHIILFICFWKLITESLYLFSQQWGIWEFIERGGSYVAPLALLTIHQILSQKGEKKEERGALSPY